MTTDELLQNLRDNLNKIMNVLKSDLETFYFYQLHRLSKVCVA